VASILLADVKHNLERLTCILPDQDLHKATTVVGAQRLLKRLNFDLIVCGVRFDDCRMFDLLRAIRHDLSLSHIPFICWENDQSELRNQACDSTAKAAKVLGASLYLEFMEVSQMSDEELRQAFTGCLQGNQAV